MGTKTDESATVTIAVVCAKPELISLKEEFNYTEGGRSFVGLVDKVSSKNGVTLIFNNGVTKLVSMRDIAQAEKVTQNYSVGQLVRAASTKSGRLSLK